ncbi:MAG: SPOR domain-containing protein [Coxiellaceae bacterium]|nr:MAG: SPOR domain-containing protein [Coxiellaceae bacterium]
MVSATSQTNANSLKLSAEQQTKVAQLSATNAANADHSYTEAEQTLLKMPTDSYTIQLMGSRDKNDLKDLVKQYQLKDTYVFETTYLEKPWFVLVYGSFKSAQTANVAIKQLPKPVQALKVWVRPMTSVQNAIKRNS